MKKRGRGVELLLTRNPRKDFFLERPSGAEGPLCLSYFLTSYFVTSFPHRTQGGRYNGLPIQKEPLLMQYRRFGRTRWNVSEIGYGMWGLAGWTGSDDTESLDALQRAVDLGCNFFDTAWAYGEGRSEQILGKVLRANAGKRLYVATKIPPKNGKWPSRRDFTLDDCYPPDHVEAYVNKSLANLGVEKLDLIQFHTWEDRWLNDERLPSAVEKLRATGKAEAIGVSVNRWEPYNGIRAVIARVPFDEGTLTGTLTVDSTWPQGDWRNTYFVPENLKSSVARAEALRPLVPADNSMAQMALRFILNNPDVSTIIPGMRKRRNVEA